MDDDGLRYIPNTATRLLTLSRVNRDALLHGSLEEIVTSYPPRSRYPHEVLQGLWSGPTGIAYLMLQVSAHKQPPLEATSIESSSGSTGPGSGSAATGEKDQGSGISSSDPFLISGRPPLDWAKAYLAGSRGHNLRLGSHGCGVSDEKLAFEAVRASVTKDLNDVRSFMSSVSQVIGVEEFADEMLYGRAGMLYLLRMVRHWAGRTSGANSDGRVEKLVDPAIAEVSNTIINRGPDWKWHGKRYLGAVHGDIGIITQLVLTSPELAPQLESALRRLLDMQLEGGNWPSSEGNSRNGSPGLVQFCHGAPGFVMGLLSLRKHFPGLQSEIDKAISRGRGCVWREGLVRKEPSLCHGIFGNAL